MAGQAYYADIMGKVFAAELCSKSYLVGFLKQLLLKFHIAEGTSCFIASGGEFVIVVSRSQFHGQKILLCTGSANDNGDVVGRTCCCAETLHLFHKEGNQCSGILDAGLGFLIEVCFVGGPSAFRDAEETVFHSLAGFDVDLCGKVATGVHLVVHVERCILAVAQIVLGIGVVDATCNILFVFVPRPYLLAFFSVDDGCSGVLAEGELSLACHFSVAEEGKCHILVVFAGFRITQNLCHLFVVATTQFEADVVEGLVHEQSETLSLNFQYGVSFEVADADIVLGQ